MINQNNEHLAFGTLGTVVGIYNNMIEMLLDEP